MASRVVRLQVAFLARELAAVVMVAVAGGAPQQPRGPSTDASRFSGASRIAARWRVPGRDGGDELLDLGRCDQPDARGDPVVEPLLDEEPAGACPERLVHGQLIGPGLADHHDGAG